MVHISHLDLSVPPLEIGRYQHYKGDFYDVIGVALHSENHEPLVIYKPLYESPVPYWLRPYDMFIDHVVFNGEQVPRFKKVNNND
jgi:hypothetical protein